MTDLRLPMNELTFDELAQLGRSVIPAVAPAWTDHNIHDPGIMLVELLAWIAEAQMYAAGRMRTGERRAYARLLGVEPHGPLPARGLVWPFAGSGMKDAPAMSWSAGRTVDAGALVTASRPDAPSFYAPRAVQLTTAQLVRVETQFANGASHDWTRTNAHQTATFLPFGAAPTPGDRLVLTCEAPASDAPAGDTPISLGFEIVNDAAEAAPRRKRRLIEALLRDAMGERRIEGVEDTTDGLLHSGVLLLPLADIAPRADNRFTLTVRSAAGGFERPPRVRRIGLNAIPIEGVQRAQDPPATIGRGLPNQQYELGQEGLMYPVADEKDFSIQVIERDTPATWTRVPDLKDSGPADPHYQLDIPTATVTFGNGVNGRVLPDKATVLAQYRASSGARGNLPANIRWTVQGLAAEFGSNPEATSGGEDADTLADLRTEARARTRTARPIVTSEDLENATLALRELGATRAVELPPGAGRPRPRGSRVLIVVGPHDDATAPDKESPVFLEAVRSRLAPRLPLGERLTVNGPTYVPLRVSAALVAARNTDPRTVQAAAVEALRTRLAVAAANPAAEWPFGRDVSTTAVKGWLRKVEGVARVGDVRLLAGQRGQVVDVLELRPYQLPRLELDLREIRVERPPEGRMS